MNQHLLKKNFLVFFLLLSGSAFSQNPIITDQFTADPTARVFDGKVYVYPSHDVNCGTNWFCMKDYHVFSSEDLINWTDHGVIVRQEDVDWVDDNANALWAPDAMEKDGKYYFYFPAIADTNKATWGRKIGVAISDTPYGPFVPQEKPIEGISGIDPGLFKDKDGQVYITWSGFGGLRISKLDDNMLELEGESVVVEGLPSTGLKEGPFMFERNGIYYFTFPLVIEKTEAIVYAMGDSPMGPFDYKGVIMDEHPTGCWTNHHSILEYNDQWYIFYHHNDLSPDFDKNRSVRADKLFFNEDGTIRKVMPTLRGVGITPATDQIQIDRYSMKSAAGATVAFNYLTNTFGGWKAQLNRQDAWVRYNDIDFGDGELSEVTIKAFSEEGTSVELILTNNRETKKHTVEIPRGNGWQEITVPLEDMPAGIQSLKVSQAAPGAVDIDWVQFK